MGGKALVPTLLFRVVLPLSLLAAAILRYNAFSFIYAFLLLLSPLFRIPTRASMAGATGKFLPLVLSLSLLAVLAHSVFHITLAAMATDDEPYGYGFRNCSEKEKIFRQIGLQKLDEASVGAIFRIVGPDVLILLVSILVLVMCKRAASNEVSAIQADAASGSGRWATKDYMLRSFVMGFLQALALLVAGVMVPSVLNAVYFLVFLITMVLWGCYKSMGMGFGYVRVLLLFYTGSHLLLLHLYQFQFFQEALDPSDFLARLFGLTGFINTKCEDPENINFYTGTPWYVYVNPAAILILYWVLAFSTNLWRKRRQKLQQQKAFSRRGSVGSNEHQVEAKIVTANETGSMVFSGSSYDLEDDKGDIEKSKISSRPHKRTRKPHTEKDRLVEAEQPAGGHYGGLQDEARPSTAADGAGEEGQACQPDEKPQPTKRTMWVSLLIHVVKQSYVLSLVAMMAWSIAYLSWLTFALLLMACFLWMMPNSRKWCLRASPFILFYVICLLLALYAFNMDLKDELPEHAGSYELSEIGMERFLYPCLSLGLQCIFTFLIVLSVRQLVKEKKTDKTDGQHIMMREKGKKMSFLQRLLEGSDEADLTVPRNNMYTYDSNTTLFIGNFVWVILSKYWIFFCTIMLAVISLTDVVIYRIIYMILCSLFLLSFQMSYGLWRKSMYLFWWVVIFYSMLVLIALYTYQFKDFPNYWKDVTGFDDDVLKDIGLEKYDTAGLFIKLLTPTLFLIIVIIQVRYFHEHFLKLSALDRFKYSSEEAPASDEEGHAQNITEDEEESLVQAAGKKSKRNRMKGLVLKCARLWRDFTNLLWRVAEVHFFKLVVLIVGIVSVNEVSALTFVYFLLLALFLPSHRTHLLLSHLIQLWTVIIILARMVFQLQVMDTAFWETSCDGDSSGTSNSTNGTTNPNATYVDNASWFGLRKITDHNIAHYERLFILLMVIVVVESIIRYHQTQHFNHPHHQQPLRGIIFIKITRPNADETLLKCLMYFANYAFYKFGLEICFVMTAVTVCVRVDAISVIYMVFMCVMMLLKRTTVAKVWPIYTLVLAVMLPIQFLILVGLPPGACLVYPWKEPLPNNLGLWLFLPSYNKPPGSIKLIVDILQLLFVCLQSFVFYLEANPSKMQDYGGGDNKEILDEVESNTPNPYPDFTIKQLTHMDLIKGFVFEFMYWVTMAIIFVTGVTRINIFSLFYVIAVFYFMWYGSELFLKPLRTLLKMWNKLVMLTILVLLLKALLQLIGCVFATDLIEEGQCWLIQLFGINCVLANADALSSNTGKDCEIDKDDGSLAWDVVCFTFLLLQRRIYLSHYFRHVVDTLNARQNLASRGAEIINRILIREVNRQKEQEAVILTNIKKQMEAIQAKQATLRKDFKEPEEHFQAIRAGDYYLLEDIKEDENQPTTLTFGKDEEAEEEKEGMDPLQVIHTAQEQGADAAIEVYDEDGKEKKKDDEQEEEEEEESGNKIKTIIMFIYTLWLSCLDWLIRVCNTFSRNYRLVGKKLASELVLEKQKIVQERLEKGEKDDAETQEPATEKDTVRLDMTVAIPEDQGDGAMALAQMSSMSLEELERIDNTHLESESAEKSRFFRLLKAFSMLVASRSELLCYFLMILDQIVYSSLLSLPLPLMVFLWGMLSVPRPSKTFWITAITYTEAIVVVKYLFQFGFFPWNTKLYPDSPYFPPRFLGIQEQSGYANVEIALLLALFLHRSLLRRYGLWKDAADISADLVAAKMMEKPAIEVTPDEPTEEAEDAGDSVDKCGEEETEEKKSKLKLGLDYIKSPFSSFFRHLTKSSYHASVDVYAPMFACDFILFIVLVLGFASFGPAEVAGGGDVTSYIKSNKIPVPFLLMILTQFIFIIIDRALFLRKQVLGKLIYQILLVIVIHVWLFFILPKITRRSFYDNTAAQIWYFIKCIYFALSAYQIRSGYPARILGNFLTKSYGYVSLIAFKVFMAIPFLLELRSVMDWMWTDTTLAIGSWLQMEDIYANIFVLKCMRENEKRFPSERAQKRGIVKYIVGGLLLVVIIFIIWFPLVFFSLFNSIFVANPPSRAEITVSMGGYQPLFKTNAIDTASSLRSVTGAQYDYLKNQYSSNPAARAFLSGFEANDLTLVAFDGASLGIWGISPASRKSLVDDLARSSFTTPFPVHVTVDFHREFKKDQTQGTQSALFTQNLRLPKYKSAREKLASVINETIDEPVELEYIYPRFLHLSGSEDVTDVPALMSGDGSVPYSNLSLSLKSDSASPLSTWWDVQETLWGPTFFDSRPGNHTSQRIYFVTFNDRRVPDSLSFLSGYGIIGLYISLILLIGRLIRGFVSNQHLTIMFRELPDVDKVLRLCLDLYLVREMKEFYLEEDLYATLIFLYRSPESLIKYTRQTIRIGNIKKKQD